MGYLILQGLSGALVGAVLFYVAGSLLLRRWIIIDSLPRVYLSSRADVRAILPE